MQNSLGHVLLKGAVDTPAEVNYRYPRYVVSNGTLYEGEKNTQKIQGTNHAACYVGAFTPSQAEQTVTVQYSPTTVGGVTYYAEGEDLPGVVVATDDYAKIGNNSGVAFALRFASGGAGGEVLSPVTATTIEPGKYTLVAAIGDTHTSATAQFAFRVGDKTVLALTTEDVAGCVKEYSTEGIVVKTLQTLTIEAVNSGGSFWVDYLYLVKTAEYDETVPDVAVVASTATVDVTDGVSPVTITATATGYQGSAIQQTVIKDAEGNTLATASGATCSYSYTPTTMGQVLFTAEATDEQGRTGLSDDCIVTVQSDYQLVARSNLGDDLGSTVFSAQTADKSYRFLYPRYLLRGTTLYETAPRSDNVRQLHYGEELTFSFANRRVERTIDYQPAVPNVVFYSEGEDIEGTRRWTWETSPIDFGKGEAFALSLGSMGVCGALTDISVTTIPAGTYRIVAGLGTTNDATYQFYLGTTLLATYATERKETINMFASGSFVITQPTTLRMTCNKGSDNSQNWLDFIYVQKVGDVPVTISEAGYATFSSPYALDFSSTDVKAYVATVGASGDVLAMQRVAGTVPAATGLFLQGTVGQLTQTDIPLATQVPAAIADNALVAHL